MAKQNEKPAMGDIRFVKNVNVGGIDPNNPFSDEVREKQLALLNRCLNDYPRGVLLGCDITVGRYSMGQHELAMQRTVYHVGFTRRPGWLEEGDSIAEFPQPTAPDRR